MAQQSSDLSDVRDALVRFVESSNFPETFLLTGSWGVGKTFLYREVLQRSRDQCKVARTASGYCSLFGLQTLDEVRDKLFEAREGPLIRDDGGPQPPSASRTYKKISGDLMRAIGNDPFVKRLGKWISQILRKAPALGGYAPLIRMVMFAAIRETIVCIDDLERRGAGIALKDLLGFVSFLREERRCKVLVIANEDILEEGDRTQLEMLREKVFDVCVRFEPPTSYALEIAVPADVEFRDEWERGAAHLNLRNIRVLKRIIGMNSQLSDALANAPEQMKRQAIATLLLVGSRIYLTRNDLPPIDFILNPFGLPDKADKTQKEWRTFLTMYGWHHADEFDMELLEFIHAGYFSPSRVESCAEQARQLLADAAAKRELDMAWRAYHESFADNELEVIEALTAAYSRHSTRVSPMNLDEVVRLLRELDAGKRADDLIDQYIAANETRADNLNLDNYQFSHYIKDPGLREKFGRAFQGMAPRKELHEVLMRLSSNDSWGGDDTEFLASLPADDYEKFFDSVAGADIHRCIKAALQFAKFANASPTDKKIGDSVTEALSRIAGRSRLNRYRLAVYGISPANGPPEPK